MTAGSDLTEPERQPTAEPRGRRRPLHALILEELKGAIRSGELPEGVSLPSEQELGQRYGASRITVRHALQRLQAEGYVRKQHGRRTEVVSREPRHPVWQISSVEDLIASADGAALDILSYREAASPEAAEALGLPPEARLWMLASLLTRDGAPYARSQIFFPAAVGALLGRADFDDVIVFRVIQRRLGIAMADVTMTVMATRAEPDDVRLLGCERGAPMLATQLVYRPAPGAAPVEVAFTRFPAETYRLSYSLSSHTRL